MPIFLTWPRLAMVCLYAIGISLALLLPVQHWAHLRVIAPYFMHQGHHHQHQSRDTARGKAKP